VTAATRARDADGQASTTAVYLYGVVEANTIRDVGARGVAGAPVQLLKHDDLAALISEVPIELRVKRSDLRSHLEVLEGAFAKTTVVPCAFGTVVASRDDVAESFLGERADELRAALARLKGRAQLNVRATYVEDVLLREVVANDPEIARLRASTRDTRGAYYERLHLGELVAGSVAELRARDRDRLLGRLADLAVDVAVEEGDELTALKASFLVPRRDVPRFEAQLEAIARDEHDRLTVELIGPLPPTAFAEA
jgi:hypothetical protein